MADTAVSEKKIEDTPVAEPWARLLGLSCELTAELAVPGFKVADLLRLAPRTVIDSHCKAGADIPLRVNGGLVAWSEFEVVRDRLAVRLTELA